MKTTKWYHRTSDRAADAILQHGFDDRYARGSTGGIWVADYLPDLQDVNLKDGLGAQVVLEIEIPDDVIERSNLHPESDRGVFLPADVVNQFPVRVFEHDFEEADEPELLKNASEEEELAARTSDENHKNMYLQRVRWFRDACWFLNKYGLWKNVDEGE